MLIALIGEGYNKVTWIRNTDNLSYEDFERRVYSMYPAPKYAVDIYEGRTPCVKEEPSGLNRPSGLVRKQK